MTPPQAAEAKPTDVFQDDVRCYGTGETRTHVWLKKLAELRDGERCSCGGVAWAWAELREG